MAQPLPRRPDLHLDGPSEIAILHPQAEERRVPDRPERAEIGVARSIETGQKPRREPVSESRVRGERPGLAFSEHARAHDQIGDPVQNGREDRHGLGRIVASIRIEEEHHVRRIVPKGRDSLEARRAVSAPRLLDHPGSVLAGHARRVVGRAVVRHDDAPHRRRGDPIEHLAQSGRLVQGGDDRVDLHVRFRAARAAASRASGTRKGLHET